MDTNDRTFWATFEHDLASLTPLVDGILARGDWAAGDLQTSADGIALATATRMVSGLSDRLITASQVTPKDKVALPDSLAGRPQSTPSITPAPTAAVPSPEGNELFTDEKEVQEELAETIATLIEVRSRIEADTYRRPRELASLAHELASATELLRLITRDVRHQEHTQGEQPIALVLPTRKGIQTANNTVLN